VENIYFRETGDTWFKENKKIYKGEKKHGLRTDIVYRPLPKCSIKQQGLEKRGTKGKGEDEGKWRKM
jgi:hypothetical protein